MKCSPSGRKSGNRWAVSLSDASRVVTGAGVPPLAATLCNGPAPSGAKTIVPFGLHVPPRGFGASHTTVILPPLTGTVLSFAPAKKPSCLLSGDQNGRCAPSAPSTRLGTSESVARIQREAEESDVMSPVTIAIQRPSGEIATSAGSG